MMAKVTKLHAQKGASAYNRVLKEIESEADSNIELGSRVRSLEKGTIHSDTLAPDSRAMVSLIKKLSEDSLDELSESVSDPRYMRRQRLRIVPHLLNLAEKPDYGPVTVATVIPRGHLVSLQTLQETPAESLKARLRADLIRAADECLGKGAKPTGWLIAGLHGTHDAETHLFQLHWHLAMAGDFVRVVDALRKRRKYASPKKGDGEVAERVVIRRKPVDDWPYVLTYILQSFWPIRVSITRPDGTPGKHTIRRRIPEPYHAQWLLWMHKQQLPDLLLPMNLTVRDGELWVR